MFGVSDLALEAWLKAKAEPATTTALTAAMAKSRLRCELNSFFIFIALGFVFCLCGFDTSLADKRLSGALQNCKVARGRGEP